MDDLGLDLGPSDRFSPIFGVKKGMLFPPIKLKKKLFYFIYICLIYAFLSPICFVMKNVKIAEENWDFFYPILV